MRIAIIGSMFGFRKGGGTKVLPSLSDITATDITDVSATISASLTTNSYEAAVEVQYGSTLSLGSTLTLTGSPFDKSKDPVAFSVDLTGLLPYSWVFYRIVVTTSKGPVATEIYHFNTLEPVELTDGNWAAMWDAEYEKNVINAQNQLAELRDKRFDCALGNEIVPDPEFNSSAGWQGLSATNRIKNGQLIFDNTGSGSVAFQMPVEDRVLTIFHIESTGIVYVVGNAFVRPGGLGDMYVNGAKDLSVANGDYIVDKVTTQMNGYMYIRIKPAGTTITFNNLSVKRILGNHAIGTRSDQLPVMNYTDGFFHFEVDDRLISQAISSIGTVYALVRRNGIDSDFAVLNELTGIGEFVTPKLTIGANVALSTFYNLDVKKINIRTVVDSADTISKLNEWFTRESHELPPLARGILGTGIWNDAAIHDDAAIPITI